MDILEAGLARDGETLLESARRAGLVPPFSCEAGNCATCIAKVTSGHALALYENCYRFVRTGGEGGIDGGIEFIGVVGMDHDGDRPGKAVQPGEQAGCRLPRRRSNSSDSVAVTAI